MRLTVEISDRRLTAAEWAANHARRLTQLEESRRQHQRWRTEFARRLARLERQAARYLGG